MEFQTNKGQTEGNVFQMDLSGFELTEEQKFLFDLKGYLVIPDVFNDDQVAAMKEQVYKITHEPQSLLPKERTVPGGASQDILTNPVVKGTLKEIIGSDFRLDNQFVTWRDAGKNPGQGPHNGGPMKNPFFHYHFTDNQIYSALTRVVVELNPVQKGDGGTVFLSGSHKANYAIPEALMEKSDANYEAYFETYDASPGSIVVFSENTCHAGPVWKNTERPRVAIFLAFSHTGTCYHRQNVPQEVIEGLDPEARWYFRDMWYRDFNKNAYYNKQNVLLINEDGTITTSP